MENNPLLMERHQEHLRTKVGVAILLFNDGKVLLGKRKKDDGTGGMYGTPGGILEHLESFPECAARELMEEVGLEAGEFTPVCVTNVRQFAPAHFVIVTLRADWKGGEPVNREPDKCEGWEWFPLDAPPELMTPATEASVLAVRNGKMLFE